MTTATLTRWTLDDIKASERCATGARDEHITATKLRDRAADEAESWAEDVLIMARCAAEDRGDGWTEWGVLREAVGA